MGSLVQQVALRLSLVGSAEGGLRWLSPSMHLAGGVGAQLPLVPRKEGPPVLRGACASHRGVASPSRERLQGASQSSHGASEPLRTQTGRSQDSCWLNKSPGQARFEGGRLDVAGGPVWPGRSDTVGREGTLGHRHVRCPSAFPESTVLIPVLSCPPSGWTRTWSAWLTVGSQPLKQPC